MNLVPMTLRAANAFIDEHHRHHGSTRGHKFSIGVERDDELVGCVVVGRPVARGLDDGLTAEVTRLCVLDDTPNACSMLYSAAWRAAREMGYRRMVTYILAEESGVSLKASGWKRVTDTAGGSWSCKSRPREDKHPTGPKTRWEVAA